jgi:hypothetical protein
MGALKKIDTTFNLKLATPCVIRHPKHGKDSCIAGAR